MNLANKIILKTSGPLGEIGTEYFTLADDYITSKILQNGSYQFEISKFFADQLKNLDMSNVTFIDAGAHFGFITIQFLNLVKDKFNRFRNILLIEANPSIFGFLKENLSLFSKKLPILFLNIALHPFYDKIILHKSRLNSGNTTYNRRNIKFFNRMGKFSIASKSLDFILNDFQGPIFLKLDIQGLDLDSLYHLSENNWNKIHCIVFEWPGIPPKSYLVDFFISKFIGFDVSNSHHIEPIPHKFLHHHLNFRYGADIDYFLSRKKAY
jgi:FkbM family methyltransferase